MIQLNFVLKKVIPEWFCILLFILALSGKKKSDMSFFITALIF